jgi:hypothetical protein
MNDEKMRWKGEEGVGDKETRRQGEREKRRCRDKEI